MEHNNIKIMMNLIRDVVCNVTPDVHDFLALPETNQQAIADLAKRHSVAQLLGAALGNVSAGASLAITTQLVNEYIAVFLRTSQLETERKKICHIFDEEKIPYICLKGGRMRHYYPEFWMRTSCDNDVLVHEEDVEYAANLLIQKLHYHLQTKQYHDFTLNSESHTVLELHFSIKENSKLMDTVLSQVWENSFRRPVSTGFEYVQSNDYFVFHLIAHMAHHFIAGGCGIRPFIDLFLLQEKADYNADNVLALCQQAGIEQFYKNSTQLINVWFRNDSHSIITQHMEKYILLGGVFGTYMNRIAVLQNQNHFHTKYIFILQRIFARTEHLCVRYPFLEKHRWLMPVYQIQRWIEAFHCGKFSDFKFELSATQRLDKSLSKEVQIILKENGMNSPDF